MFKLILHHTYKLAGEAIDISDNENHGFRTAAPFLPDGRSSGSGAIQFSGGPSRIRVTTKPVWQNLRALKIETWVKLEALGQRRNLVEGHLSFAFFIEPDGILWGTFLGPATPGGSPTWHGANSKTHAPDGTPRTVPRNKWVKLTYLHDGIASLRLYIDDVLVAANYNLISGVPSLGADGVHIGHWPGDDRYTLAGEIDEVKIWKYDPEAAYKQFFCRPLDKEQMRCWREVFKDMADLLRDKEKSQMFIGVMRCLWDVVEDFVRAIHSKGEAAINANREFSRRYREIWCKGDLKSEEVRAFLREWRAWIDELLGPDYMDGFRQRINDCWAEFGGDRGSFDPLGKRIAECDPTFAAYYELIQEAFEEEPGNGEEPPAEGLLEQILKILQSLFDIVRRLFSQRS